MNEKDNSHPFSKEEILALENLMQTLFKNRHFLSGLIVDGERIDIPYLTRDDKDKYTLTNKDGILHAQTRL
jgi:hypothetical protein